MLASQSGAATPPLAVGRQPCSIGRMELLTPGDWRNCAARIKGVGGGEGGRMSVLSKLKLRARSCLKKNAAGFLEGIEVQRETGEKVLLTSLWRSQVVVLKVLRRLGCPLCRYETRLLSELKPEFDALKIKFLAVGFEKVGLYDFLSGCYWDWEVLVDAERAVYLALDLKRMSVSAGLKDLVSSSTLAAIRASNRAGIYGDFQGDGFQLGGTFVVERETGKILYEYRQVGPGSYVSLKEVYERCGGDPDDVDEQAPKQCISYSSPA